jgi:hypothetical protein
MSQKFYIRKLENGQITIETLWQQPGDISLLFDVTTGPEVDAVRTSLHNIVEADVIPPIQTGLKSVYADNKNGRLPMKLGVGALVAFVLCALFLYYGQKDYPTWSFALAALWTVAVPIYFFGSTNITLLNMGTWSSSSNSSGSKT